MTISKDEFRASLGRFVSGVTVVTTKDTSGKLHGLTVSAFCSVSLEPPLILVCVHKETGSHYAFEESKLFVVNILAEDQQHLSNQFASPREDKFEGVSFRNGIEDLPVLEGCLVNLECRLKHAYDGGDHTIFVGEIHRAHLLEGNPLTYFQGSYRQISQI
jgi:flavin reductase (DIM6/NTAB) family NADH-FMN oxidoreductase RutF